MTEQMPQPTPETLSYQQMEGKLGSDGMAMLDVQLDIWNKLNQRELHSPLREALKSGNIDIPKGSLMHSIGMHGFSEDTLRGIAQKGIISGELLGISEDSETHGCADFFKTPLDTNITAYFEYARETVEVGRVRTQRGERLLTRGITFIIDPQTEGLSDLLKKDGYQNVDMQTFIKPPHGRSTEDTAAILGGVPSGAIAGIVVPDRILGGERVASVLELFPDTPVYSQSGERVLAEVA